ncbi:DNA cytosine methyltransferase [Blastococcus sp. TF02A-35]|uniref:DNA cytosine methyltransferase n=1 Tax=Blastococcus sp. TF02A-35 TaxID=2559612 RepID=UPI00107411BD|nr:DNA cytosine methyltransferase [Blastococcus sp. TF02A_35]TFV44852.1 DNA cytosine methyltransferase [Blastococcus sp. TF02A_35]
MSDGLSFVSLYSGAGGMDLGFAEAGFTPVWANDIDPFAVRTYNKQFEKLAEQAGGERLAGHVAVAGDVTGDAMRHELPGEGAATVVIGGPPCQGFSVAGRMDPSDPRSRHVWEFLEVVKRVQPEAFVMENVKALAVNRRWSELLIRLREEAHLAGYSTELHLLNASHFGVPQARERMFLVGTRSGSPLDLNPPTRSQPPTLRSVLETLPNYGEPGNDAFCTARVTPARIPVLRRSPFAGMLFNGQGRPLNLDAPAPTLPASMGGNRTPIIDQAQLDDPDATPWVVEYHRHLMAGGKPVAEIPTRLRRLTVQEAAAIQTFPRDMPWQGTQSVQFRQIGNAVPPMLAFHVASALKKVLVGVPADVPVEDLAADDRGALELAGV